MLPHDLFTNRSVTPSSSHTIHQLLHSNNPSITLSSIHQSTPSSIHQSINYSKVLSPVYQWPHPPCRNTLVTHHQFTNPSILHHPFIKPPITPSSINNPSMYLLIHQLLHRPFPNIWTWSIIHSPIYRLPNNHSPRHHLSHDPSINTPITPPFIHFYSNYSIIH